MTEASGFDELWRSYWLDVQQAGPLTRTRYRLLLAELPRDMGPTPRILDVGCGPGTLLGLLQARLPSATLTGVEFSATASAAAMPALRDRIITGDILAIAPRLGVAAFDLVVCSEVLEHVPDPDAVMESLATLAAPEGTLLFTVPAGMRHWSAQDVAACHLRRFEMDEFDSLLRRHGLEVERLYAWGGPVSWLYNRAINAAGPAEAAQTAGSRWGRLAASAATVALRFDDLFRGRNGFQLVARARRPAAPTYATP